jgi:hypothetical protein
MGLIPQLPYGVACIKELLRFIVAMINRRDRANSDTVITLGLSLLTVALETGGASLSKFPTLMEVSAYLNCADVLRLPGILCAGTCSCCSVARA